MKNNCITILFISVLAITTNKATAQIYRAATSDALENNGREWVEKKLPPSVITFSDYSGEVEIKTPISSLFAQNPGAGSSLQTVTDTLADFTMELNKEQLQQQISTGKMFTTSGDLLIYNISKKAIAQCVLMPHNNPAEGFNIAVVIRFNPTDYGMKITGETGNTPLIVRVAGKHVNKFLN